MQTIDVIKPLGRFALPLVGFASKLIEPILDWSFQFLIKLMFREFRENKSFGQVWVQMIDKLFLDKPELLQDYNDRLMAIKNLYPELFSGEEIDSYRLREIANDINIKFPIGKYHCLSPNLLSEEIIVELFNIIYKRLVLVFAYAFVAICLITIVTSALILFYLPDHQMLQYFPILHNEACRIVAKNFRDCWGHDPLIPFIMTTIIVFHSIFLIVIAFLSYPYLLARCLPPLLIHKYCTQILMMFEEKSIGDWDFKPMDVNTARFVVEVGAEKAKKLRSDLRAIKDLVER